MPRKLPRSYIRSLEWDAEMVQVGPHRFVNRAIIESPMLGQWKKEVAATLSSSPANHAGRRHFRPCNLDWPCKGIAWDCPGHSPITKSDRLDARFVNSLGKPPRKGKQIVGPAPDIERSNLEPGESVFDRRRLPFDRGRFKTGQRVDYTDYRLPDYEEDRRLDELKTTDTSSGAAVPPVCEGASCGGDEKAKSTAKFGSTSYERLNREARRPLNLVAATVPGAPLYFGRIAAAAIMKHKLFRNQKIKRDDGSVFIRRTLRVRHNRHLLGHIHRGWFGKNYPWRWEQAASCYVDPVRIAGKVTNSADLTWSQAATRIADEALDNLSTRQGARLACPLTGRACPPIFYEKPFLGIFLVWLMAAFDAHEFWSFFYMGDFCCFAAEHPEKEPPGQTLKLNIPSHKPKPITQRDKVIASHWPLAANRCRTVPKDHRADAIQACMERLTLAFERWKPEHGSFGTFAERAIEWAIQDFMKEQRKQVPVQRSINLNDPAVNANDDDDNTPPEQPNMLKPLNALQGQANEAKRRLVADRLDCLDLRERRVIERRLCLNGYREPPKHRELAAELGLSIRTIQRIEETAVEKLREAVA
jgi:RNA polymerase sigma factor (sigma-70 family)